MSESEDCHHERREGSAVRPHRENARRLADAARVATMGYIGHRMTTRSLLLSLLSLVLLGMLCHAAEPITCPASITTRQDLTAQVAGWTAMKDDTPHNLAGITFYDGPPAEKASLVYDQIKKVKGEQIATWTFDPHNKRQTWLACSYAGTIIELARTLPPQTTTCSVTYDTQESIAGMPLIKKIACK